MCKQKSTEGAALTHTTCRTPHPLFLLTCLLKTCSRKKVSTACFCRWGLFIFPSTTQLSWRGTITNTPPNFSHSKWRKHHIWIKLKWNFWNFLGQNIILIRKLAYRKGRAVPAPRLTSRRWEQPCWDKCPISGHGSAASLFCSPKRRFPGSKGQSR